MKTLTTDQTITLLKTLTIFIENRDPFTTENIINELKRDGDQLNGFYDDNGNSIADELYVEIDDAIDNLILQFFPDFTVQERRVYIYEPDYFEDKQEKYDEEEELIDEDIDDVNVDKEGNQIPKEHYDVKVEDDGDGRMTYSLKPRFDEVDNLDDEDDKRGAGWYKDQDGNWDWDRDAAESASYAEDMYEDPNWNNYDKDYHVPQDHEPEYELTVDKQKRINIGKKILVNKVGWKENERVIVVGDKDGKNFYIVGANDDSWGIGDDEEVVGEYELKNGALRIGLGTIIKDIQPGDVMYARIHWPVMCTDDNLLYIHIYFK